MWNPTSERNGFSFRVVAVRFGRMLRERAQRLGFAKSPQRGHDDFRHRVRRAFPIFEFPGLQSPFDKHYGSFRHEFFGDLRQLIPSNAANPFDALLSVLVIAERLMDGEREIRDRFTSRCGSQFRILSGISEQNDLVYANARHDVDLPLLKNSEKYP